MTDTNQPGANFSPDVDNIPDDCALERLDERRYLIGGKLLEWNGAMRTVTSPLYVNGEQRVIGSCPELTEAESLAAVEDVSKAWDNGRGA